MVRGWDGDFHDDSWTVDDSALLALEELQDALESDSECIARYLVSLGDTLDTTGEW